MEKYQTVEAKSRIEKRVRKSFEKDNLATFWSYFIRVYEKSPRKIRLPNFTSAKFTSEKIHLGKIHLRENPPRQNSPPPYSPPYFNLKISSGQRGISVSNAQRIYKLNAQRIHEWIRVENTVILENKDGHLGLQCFSNIWTVLDCWDEISR